MARASIFTIPPHVPFADALASGLLASVAGDQAALSRIRILLPNRRAVRTVADAFLRQSDGKALLMPRLQPLGDIVANEDALATLLEPALALHTPASATTEARLLTIAPLVKKWLDESRKQTVSMSEALATAQPLLALLDQLHYAGVERTDVAKLVEDDLAEHWQHTLSFLDIVLTHWPQILKTQNKIDPAVARTLELRTLAAHWQAHPPAERIVVAGTTGTVPAVAELIRVVAALPHAMVVLPGLDNTMDDAAWDHIKPTHPQYALKNLLAVLSEDRRSILQWPSAMAASAPEGRTIAVQTALLPAIDTARWRLATPSHDAFAAVKTVEASSPQAEARVIALAMRRQLETPGKTAALVTFDRTLGRRVAAQLQRYGITVDDSAGHPLVRSSLYAFFDLIADCGSKKLAPVALLGLAKHPLAVCGMSRTAWLEGVRLVDRKVLRGPRPASGLAGLKVAIEAGGLALDGWFAGLSAALAPWCDAMSGPPRLLEEWLDLHIKTAEALATGDDGTCPIWTGEVARAVSTAFAAVLASARENPLSVSANDYAASLQQILATQVVRPAYGTHPRLFIWGPLEARLQRADLMILGGLNEANWPPAPEVDPFLSDTMRGKLGLPTSEFRLGQSAHDFAQGLGAAAVLLTRSKKSSTEPLVASRFWQRLTASLGEPLGTDIELLDLANRLDVPDVTVSATSPRPTPPLSARPKDLYVTDIDLWRRNPYALYAKKILKLSLLYDIDGEPGARERGTAIHAAFETFMKLPEPARNLAALLECGKTALAKFDYMPAVPALWWPRFEQLAEQFMELQAGREDWHVVGVEVVGRHYFPDMDFTMRGRADRIDMNSRNKLDIIDYKSGDPPTNKAMAAGYALQLPLLGLIASSSGFDTIKGTAERLSIWPAKAKRDGKPNITNFAASTSAEELIGTAYSTLKFMVEKFAVIETFYNFEVGPQRGPNHDYDHLARVGEWLGRDHG